ncbi:MAG TPA: hypothetical protein VMB34_24905 [Acetobacteraceae bacterium]|nr:hypothetical protein [Acetobacteraceae bacterium]
MPFDNLEFAGESAKFEQSWSTVKSAYPADFFNNGGVDRHRTGKRVASGMASGASLGLSAAQLATGTSSLAVAGAVVAGAAVSATGVGLVAAGAALTVGSMVNNARSLVKTLEHHSNLKIIKLRYDAGEYNVCRCRGNGRGMDKDHAWIGTEVLPYIIRQKQEKTVKKGVGVLPGVSLGVSAYSIGRWAYKSIAGTKGVMRSFAAHVLARHLITHDCKLAEDIVAELLSVVEMVKLKTHDSDAVGAAIKDKMKSV